MTMSDDNYRVLYTEVRQENSKYIYFLLTASGAAIAFAVNQTDRATLTYSQIPLACAVIAWAMSFFFGCRHLHYVRSSLQDNLKLLLVGLGQHPVTGNNPNNIALAVPVIRDAFDANSDRANVHGYRQFRFLITGTILYVLWHILEMYIRTSSLPSH